ncbi:ATP-binding protein [Ferruginibacter yonginensis]|uniref:ATP-binding protein n=1 Tax=Ferruginibacter yonginensis TaxID=1310416 RepID=A0ABV8QS22_9BACT
MHFNDVIGQQALKQQLTHMIQQNRLSHALLFLGKEGVGALPLAIAFAQYICCENNPLQTNKKKEAPAAASLFGEEPAIATNTDPASFTEACGICSSCTKAAQLVHPDIHFSYPTVTLKSGDKPISTNFITQWRKFIAAQPYGNVYDWLQEINTENKQGNITAEECNDIIRKMSLKSFESAYKILIMWMPEMLGKNGNKLLKLIEEPPPDTLFILVAENDALILPTILSRTQLVKVPLLQPADIQQALVTQQHLPLHTAKQIASICEGNYHEALQQLQHADDNWETMLKEWLNATVRFNAAAQVKWIDETAKIGREKQKQFLKYFTHILEQSIRYSANPTLLSEHTSDSIISFAQKFNKMCDATQLEAIAQMLSEAAYYIERNANAKMLFHALTIRLYHIITNKSLILIQ